MSVAMSNHGYTVRQAAIILDVTPQRVRQLAPENVKRIGGMLFLTIGQIQRMSKRNTKPGPKRKPTKERVK